MSVISGKLHALILIDSLVIFIYFHSQVWGKYNCGLIIINGECFSYWLINLKFNCLIFYSLFIYLFVIIRFKGSKCGLIMFSKCLQLIRTIRSVIIQYYFTVYLFISIIRSKGSKNLAELWLLSLLHCSLWYKCNLWTISDKCIIYKTYHHLFLYYSIWHFIMYLHNQVQGNTIVI